MPYQPTNPYPYNTAIDLDDGLQFRFKADNYDVITSFEIEIYDLLKNKKLYTIVRCLGEISDDTIVKGNEQLLQIFNENNEQIYLDYFTEDCGTLLPLKSKRNGLNIGELDLSKFLATIEQLEKQKYYSEIDNAENLTITNSEAFVINEDGIIVEYLPSVLSEEEQTNLVIPYEIIQTVGGVTTKTKVRGIASGVFGTRTLTTNTTESETTKSATATSISLLQSIVIPSCVIAIGDDNESSIGAFEECSNLTKVAFNYGITKIGANTFKKCSSLQQINLLDSISEIGVAAFQECSKLIYVNLPSELKEIKANCFNGAGLSVVDLPEYVSYIGTSAFANCKNLININTTSNLKEIGETAFANCVNLVGKTVKENNVEIQRLSIVEGIQKIDNMAFNGCINLKIVELPKSLLQMGEKIFSRCYNITQITLPFVGEKRVSDIVTHSVFGYIFGNSDLLDKFDENNKNLYNTRITYSIYYIPNSLTTVTITDQQILPSGAFQDCQHITEVNLPNITEQISDYCFALCSNLKTFTCPIELKIIGKSAFSMQNKDSSNSNTDNFNISFTNIANTHDLKIGEYAFAFREDIVSLDIPNFTSEIGESAFYKAFVSNKDTPVSLKTPYLNPVNGFEGLFRDKDNSSNIVYPLGLTKIIINKVKDNKIETNSFNITVNDDVKNNIKEIELPDEVTSIGDNAFNSIGFTTFKMPFNVSSIGTGAFNFSDTTVFYWSTLLDKNSALAAQSKADLFGDKITQCYGNQGVEPATDTTSTKIHNYVKGEIANTTDKVIKDSTNTNTIANFSVPACLFGYNKVENIAGSCGDNLNYEIINQHILNIMGYGNMWDFELKENSETETLQTNTPWISSTDKIIEINFPAGISKIGKYAFYNFSELETLNFAPATTTLTINDYAFSSCSKLIKIILPENVVSLNKHCFENCTSLKNLYIPDSVVTIDDEILYNDSMIENISFPSVYSNNEKFDNVGSLWYRRTSSLSSTSSSFNSYSNNGNYYLLPCSLKQINILKGILPNEFFGASKLISVDKINLQSEENGNPNLYSNSDKGIIPLTLELVLKENVAVNDMIGLVDISDKSDTYNFQNIIIHSKYKLPNCALLKNIGVIETLDLSNIFYQSSYITFNSYYVPEYSGDYNNGEIFSSSWSRRYGYWSHTFNQYVIAPHNIILPKTWNTLNMAFIDSITCGQENLQHIKGGNITSIEEYTFYGKRIGTTSANTYNTGYTIQTIELAPLENLGTGAFYKCKDFVGNSKEGSDNIIELQDTISSIPQYCFCGCKRLTKIKWNNKPYVNINGYLHITIGAKAFCDCIALEEIQMNTTSSLTLGAWAFANCKNLCFDSILDSSGQINPYYSSIYDGTFCNCKKLIWPTHTFKKQSYGCFAFFGCEQLLSRTINGSINQICFERSGSIYLKDFSFAGCNIQEVQLEQNTQMAPIGNGAFMGFMGSTITLPFLGLQNNAYDNYGDSDTDKIYKYCVALCNWPFGVIDGKYDSNNTGKMKDLDILMKYCAYFINRASYGDLDYEDDDPIGMESEIFALKEELVTNAKAIYTSVCSNYNIANEYTWLGTIPIALQQIYFQISPNKITRHAFNNWENLTVVQFPTEIDTIDETAFENAGVSSPSYGVLTNLNNQKAAKAIKAFAVGDSLKNLYQLYLSREKEYYWDIKLLGDKYDVYITDNNTYEDKNSYLPTIYAPNFEGVEPEQQITIQGENTYLIDNIQTFKNEGKIYYRQSKGVMSGQLSYYGVANGTLNYFEDTQVYTVDEELFNVLPTEPVKFSTGSKYTSDTYVGTICAQNGEVVVKLDNETEYSRFEFGAAIALQNTIITQGSLPEGLLNVVKEGTKFTVSTDSSVQTVTAINDYFNITFTPGIKNTTSGYTNVQMTLADKDKALILPNDLTTKQVLIVINTIGDITMDGKKEEEIKQAKVDENLLSLMIAGETTFLLDNKEYIVRSIDKKNQIIIFSDTSERGYILPEERDKKQKIRLVSNYIDLASEDFDITNLVLTLNYINIYTVNKIENYAYTKENEYQIPTEDGEKLYLVTCEEVVNPTNFEVNDRSLEKNALLERQSMILTVKSTDGTAIPHLLVEGDSYYSIYSNCIKSPAYYFRTLNKEPISIKCNNKNVAEDIVNLNGGSATFVAETNNNISYYVWELYEYYIDDYILIDKKTDKYSSTIFYDYHMFKDNIKYKLKLTVVTKEGLHVSKEIVINVAFSEDLILQGAFVERDCLRQAIAIDLREARFRYKIPKNQLSGTLSYNKTDKEFIIEDGLKRLLSSSPLKFSIGDSFDINNYRGIISLQGGQIQVVLKEDIEGMSQESSKDTEQDTEQEQEQNNKYAEFENGVTITLQECYSICYICPFSKEESTTILDIYGTVKGFYVIRTIKDEPDTSVIVGYVNGFTSRFYDYSFQREETYEYSIVPIFNPAGTNTDNEEELVRGIAYKIKPYIRFNTQVISVIGTKTNFNAEDIELSELENCYKIDDSEFGRWYFKLNAEDKNVNVVTDKAVYENGYQFPSVNQTDRNYKTGNVTVMLGNYYQNEDKQWSYKDSIRLQNKFQEFANNGKVKMLRDEIGNVLPVDITLTSFDYLPQAVPTSISVTFEWTQVNSEDKLGVYDYRKAKELDKIYVLPFTTREDVLNKPLEVQGLYFEYGRRIVPSKELKLTGQGVEYDGVTGYITLTNKAPKKAITVTIEVKNDESIKTTFVIPAIE